MDNLSDRLAFPTRIKMVYLPTTTSSIPKHSHSFIKLDLGSTKLSSLYLVLAGSPIGPLFI